MPASKSSRKWSSKIISNGDAAVQTSETRKHKTSKIKRKCVENKLHMGSIPEMQETDSNSAANINSTFRNNEPVINGPLSKEDMLLRIHKLKNRLSNFENKFQLANEYPIHTILNNSCYEDFNRGRGDTGCDMEAPKCAIPIKINCKGCKGYFDPILQTCDCNMKPNSLIHLLNGKIDKSSQCVSTLCQKSLTSINKNESVVVFMQEPQNYTNDVDHVITGLKEMKNTSEKLHFQIVDLLNIVSSDRTGAHQQGMNMI